MFKSRKAISMQVLLTILTLIIVFGVLVWLMYSVGLSGLSGFE